MTERRRNKKKKIVLPFVWHFLVFYFPFSIFLSYFYHFLIVFFPKNIRVEILYWVRYSYSHILFGLSHCKFSKILFLFVAFCMQNLFSVLGPLSIVHRPGSIIHCADRVLSVLANMARLLFLLLLVFVAFVSTFFQLHFAEAICMLSP